MSKGQYGLGSVYKQKNSTKWSIKFYHNGQMVRESSTGSVGEAQALGHYVAAQLLAAGAGQYIGGRVQ